MILAFLACIIAGTIIGVVATAAWALHHAPVMDDGPSPLDQLDRIISDQ